LRTALLKQPGLENNFSENNFSPTARTNCEDKPRISSLRTPSPCSLRTRTCISHVHIAERVLYTDCAEKGFCCASLTLCGLSGLVNPQQIKRRASTHAASRNTLPQRVQRVAGSHRQPITNNTIHMRCSHHTHWAHASLPRGERIINKSIF